MIKHPTHRIPGPQSTPVLTTSGDGDPLGTSRSTEFSILVSQERELPSNHRDISKVRKVKTNCCSTDTWLDDDNDPTSCFWCAFVLIFVLIVATIGYFVLYADIKHQVDIQYFEVKPCPPSIFLTCPQEGSLCLPCSQGERLCMYHFEECLRYYCVSQNLTCGLK
ncbi:6197_t:CDS:2 [Funneliformis geosporum]|uniref:565_t:CDS:1 n=1 Tax=Funneliformis geosporum TaxID=1117311 RepID=A0A9W4SM42_9GLOM|nr:6197_t:CDS:2 [Funneliformis geosporum]CAI2174305.1 565_t:CDS:2 [Funneliformis geosporum]